MTSLISCIHDPENKLFDITKQLKPILDDIYDNWFLAISDNTDKRLIDLINGHVISIKPKTNVSQARREALKLVNDNNTYHYCDFDRVLFWAFHYENELRQSIKFINNYDFVIFERTKAAFDSHPNYQKQTENEANVNFSLQYGKNIDILSGSRGLSKKAIDIILENSVSQNAGVDAEWVMIAKNNNFNIGSFYADGLAYESKWLGIQKTEKDENKIRLKNLESIGKVIKPKRKEIGTGTFEIEPKAKEYLSQAINIGRLSYGPFSKKFEKDFAQVHNCNYGILSNSGTSSLLIALQALKEMHGWQNGDEVIVPALTFVATVNVVIQSGLKPVLVDVEKRFYGIDCTLIEQSITKKTRAIIPVHTFGQPCDMRHITAIADYHNLKIIEDSCEAMFVKHYDRPVGSWSDIACFSTYVAHLITTGVGGIAITDKSEYAKIMRSLVNHGLAYSDLSSDKDNFEPMKVKRDFVFERVGHSFRITELEAAIGLAQLDTWQDMIKKRQDNAAYLTNNLQRLSEFLQLPLLRDNTNHSWMMYPIVCKQNGVRDKLTSFLESGNISTRRMLPLTCQPVYKDWCNEDDYPVAKWINDNGLYIGCHQGLSEDNLSYIIDCFEEFFDGR